MNNELNKVLDIHAQQGTKVKCVHWDWGYDIDQMTAKKHLKKDGEYTVDHIDIFNSYSYLYLREFPHIVFNAIMFISVKENELKGANRWTKF